MEARLVSCHQLRTPQANAYAIEVEVVVTHVTADLVEGQRPGHIDPLRWDPLIMKFAEFFGGGSSLQPSRLAAGFGLDHGIGPQT